MPRTLSGAALSIAFLARLGIASGQTCNPEWAALHGVNGPGVTGGGVGAFDVFDDGFGTGLFVSGSFTAAGTGDISGIARWNGLQWRPLGGTLAAVGAMAGVNHGSGPFLYALRGGLSRWNGASWTVVLPGFVGILAMTAFDDDGPGPRVPGLYVGGGFSAIAGVAAKNIARFDGTTWEPLGSGVVYTPTGLGAVNALEEFDDDGPGPRPPGLYVGGFFTHAGGIPANNIARWDGTTWENLGPGIPHPGGMSLSSVRSLQAGLHNGQPALFVGGFFQEAGGAPGNQIARWDGQNWFRLGDGIGTGAGLTAMAWFDDGTGGGPALYAGGPTATTLGVSRWDGASWSGLGTGLPVPAEVSAMTVFDDDGPGPRNPGLYVGGTFAVAGGVTVNNIARWGCNFPPACYANCTGDHHPVTGLPLLTIADFGCFQTRFVQGDPYANCTGDHHPVTGQPILTVADFGCFQTRFVAGCP